MTGLFGQDCEGDLPSDLNTPEFAEAWASWMAYRKERKMRNWKYTKMGIRIQWRRLAQWGHDRAVAAIEYSIAQNYQGIFEDKTNGYGTAKAGQDRRTSPEAAAERRGKKHGREYCEEDQQNPPTL